MGDPLPAAKVTAWRTVTKATAALRTVAILTRWTVAKATTALWAVAVLTGWTVAKATATLWTVAILTRRTVTEATATGPANPTMVKAWGVQVLIDGQEVGRKTSDSNKEWWSNPSLPPQEAALLNKADTPFAPLWGDFHLEIKPR